MFCLIGSNGRKIFNLIIIVKKFSARNQLLLCRTKLVFVELVQMASHVKLSLQGLATMENRVLLNVSY